MARRSIAAYAQPASRVLVIEDIRTFRFVATYARTVREAWVLLFTQEWDEVWFDYDMGLTRDSDNTYELAVEMERRAHNGIPLDVKRVVVHSANPHGGDRLMAALSRSYDTVRVSANDWIVPGSEELEWIGP